MRGTNPVGVEEGGGGGWMRGNRVGGVDGGGGAGANAAHPRRRPCVLAPEADHGGREGRGTAEEMYTSGRARTRGGGGAASQPHAHPAREGRCTGERTAVPSGSSPPVPSRSRCGRGAATPPGPSFRAPVASHRACRSRHPGCPPSSPPPRPSPSQWRGVSRTRPGGGARPPHEDTPSFLVGAGGMGLVVADDHRRPPAPARRRRP